MKDSVQKAKQAGKSSQSNGQDAADDAPRLTFTIGETKEKVTPARLAKDKFADALRQRCDTATSTACNLKQLLALPDAERWLALDFLAGLKNCTFTVTGNCHDHLFDAVLALPVKTEKTEPMRNWKLAALEAAVLCYPDALDIACNRVRERMRAMKVTGVKNASLLAEAREILSQLQRAGQSASTKTTTVLMAVPDAPVSDKVVVPSGWLLTDRAVERSGEPAPSICAPVVIAERGADAQRGAELFALAWKRNDRWYKRIVNRREVADQRAILMLAESGLPVNSINARTLVQYLDDYESANLDALPCVRVSGRMGWQGNNGKDGFLWGHNLVTADGIHFDGKSEQSAPPIRFRGLDAGEEQLAGGFRRGGTFEGWLKAVKPLADHPRALIGLYGAFVPPMLQILGAFDFMIDFAGSTSEGKTTAL
ncbi:MAG: DUF927 domain-containing protein, partial [Bacteroidales bacterium]|nr:DUF927 domain-containing protein [Bacteroidales bacterium]